MMGQAGAKAVGDASVSWMQNQAGAAGGPGAPAQSTRAQAGAAGGPDAPAQSMKGQAGAAGGPGGPSQSMMGQAGAGAVGDAAISWNQSQQVAPGQPGQSMKQAGPGGPGGPTQSMMGQAGAGAVGDAAVSWNDGNQTGPGQPGQSMKAPEGGPGKAGESVMGAAGGPGQAGQSMKGPEAGPGKPGESVMGAAGGPGQAAQSAMEAGAAGGPGAPNKDKAGDGAEAGAAGGPGKAKADAELKQGESKKSKDEMGAAGGPGAAEEDDASDLFQGKSDEDQDLVDPDADRPDFGGKGPTGKADEDGPEFGAGRKGADKAGAKGAKAVHRAVRQKSKPINPAYLTATVTGIAVLSLGALLWFGRGMLEDMWPGFKSFYETTGVAEARPGDGLRWKESSKRLQRIGGVESLVVVGFVSNIDKIVKPVPVLKLQLLNERQEVIQESETTAPVPLLAPNETTEVELRLELPDMARAKGGYRMAWAGEDE